MGQLPSWDVGPTGAWRLPVLYVQIEERITGRPSVPPEQLLLASLLQAFYGIRSELLGLEQLSYHQLFRWFVGLNPDGPVRHPTTYGLRPSSTTPKIASGFSTTR
jgi:hypothetical protein